MAFMRLKQTGRLVASIAHHDISHWLEENELKLSDFDVELTPQEQQHIVRLTIQQQAGDTQSLLGTTADASQLLLYGFTSLITKLYTANSLADVRGAAAPFADLSNNFLTKLENGEVKLPFMAKGLESVVTDIEQRATTVAEILQEAIKQ